MWCMNEEILVRKLSPSKMRNRTIIVYALLLLAVCITTIATDCSRRTSQHQWKWDTGLASYPGIHDKNKAYGHSIHREGTRKTVKDCPYGCYCAFMKFRDVLMLVVRDCKADPFDNLPKFFNTHRNEMFLMLNRCHLSRLPQEILSMHMLAALLLIGNELREIPSQLQQLTRLSYLQINENNVEYAGSDNLTKQSKLTMLSQNKLQSLPEGIWILTQLQYLLLDNNNIKSLPKGIGKLSQLLVLSLGHNELETLPYELGNLTCLSTLNLDYNKIKIVPSAIGKMTGLQHLTLAGNRIQTLPAEMRNLNSLEVLDLIGNLLEKVPPLPRARLGTLGLGRNMIKTFPCEELTEIRLVLLDLDHNDLKSFDCGKLNYFLTALSLSHNAVEDLSCTFEIMHLEFLDLSYNNISTIPRDCLPFSHLSSIHTLRISFNKLSVLHLRQFCSYNFEGSFRFISFRNNMIRAIDTTDSILDHCFQTGAVIDLANNQLSTLDSWPLLLAEMITITLNVSGNNLSEFTNSAGIFLSIFNSGTRFLLQQNQIRYFMDVFDGWNIAVNTTKNLNTLLTNIYFDLGCNPLVCDCIDYEIYRYIQTLRTEQYNNLVCHEPLSSRGKSPHSIPLGNFMCNIEDNCPKGCTCVNVPHSQSINVTCESYNQTDIPESVPDLPNEKYGYQLDIQNQKLHEITLRPYLQKVTEIMLSNNSISAIKINSSNIFQWVRILYLDNNNLQRLPKSVVGMTNDTALEVRLGSNPWVCDCETMVMKNWIMLNLHILKDQDIIRCHSPPSMVGVKVKAIERSMVCPDENKTAVYVVGAISSVAFVFLVYLGITDRLKYTNWRLVGSDECDGEGKEFDLFMCSCSADTDSEYVENYLIPELERRDFRVLYHREHFHGGKPIHVNMSEAIEKSKRTLVFFSNNFTASAYSMFEFHSAYDLDIQNRTRRLITIKDTDLDFSKLDISELHYFQKHTYIEREDVKFWKLLECTLPRKRLGAQVRLF